MKRVFAGTSAFAVPSLEALAGTGLAPELVITRPDRPAGRGLRSTASPVRLAAARLGLPVHTPERLNDPDEIRVLQALEPDLLVVAAYGQILGRTLLALPRFGCVNVHASLLPAWRGASPVAHSLLAGDTTTGVTLMQMDEGLDTGPILAQVETDIRMEETCGELTARLALLGARLLVEALPQLEAGRLRRRAQDSRHATLAPALRKMDGHLDWLRPALDLHRRVRAFTPEPGAWTSHAGGRLLVRRSHPLPDEAAPPGPPGTVGSPRPGEGVPVRCGEGALLLVEVQPEGRGEMSAEAAMRGRHLREGVVLGAG